jgi:hypothetical protein
MCCVNRCAVNSRGRVFWSSVVCVMCAQGSSGARARQLLAFVLLAFVGGRRRRGASACDCDVRLYQASGFGNAPCSKPGVDFGCYPGEDSMWIRPPCGSIFRCNADRHDVGSDPSQQTGATVRCGSRYFRPASGQTRLNCSCAPPVPPRAKEAPTKHFFKREPVPKRVCGEHASVDPSGGVSAAYRRLPQPAGANPAVKCCRNKGTSRGPIDWNVTLAIKDRNFAAWPRACEALCDAEPSGRCRYFSHSFRFNNCILCAACVPEIMLGDDSYASFQRISEDPAVLYTGTLA